MGHYQVANNIWHQLIEVYLVWQCDLIIEDTSGNDQVTENSCAFHNCVTCSLEGILSTKQLFDDYWLFQHASDTNSILCVSP